jgi:hypothetical protein
MGNNRRFSLSIIQLFFSLAAFIAVSYAWFVASTMVETDPLNFYVSHEYIESYEITFFTEKYVYRYNRSADMIEIYDTGTSSWVDPTTCVGSTCTTPSYGYLDRQYEFQGIFINQYDPIIPRNNENNNLFVELRLEYDVETDRNLTIDARAIASNVSYNFGTSNFGPYYLSEVIYLQHMPSSDYALRAEGENIFFNLKEDFLEVDTSEEYIYPYLSFYGETDTYYPQFEVDTITLLHTESEVILYFNFFYYEDKIEDIILAEALTLPITTENYLRFFQDIMIIIKEGNQS